MYFHLISEPIESDPCDPDPCGPYSQKYEQDGHCVCSCLPGYQGIAPNCHPECVVSSDCSLVKACQDYKCIDPCLGDICGINARCQVVSHNAICQCPPGYIGDPFSRCTIRKYLYVVFATETVINWNTFFQAQLSQSLKNQSILAILHHVDHILIVLFAMETSLAVLANQDIQACHPIADLNV